MHCEACSQVNSASSRFCQGCGVQLRLVCAACGHASTLDARYCGNCGANLAGAASLQSAPRSSVSPRAHLTYGEIKQVTVLFSDLVSSTELVAELDAEGAMQRLE